MRETLPVVGLQVHLLVSPTQLGVSGYPIRGAVVPAGYLPADGDLRALELGDA